MFESIAILLTSMILAILIRLKPCKNSCILKKILPYLVLLCGGILATYVMLINK